MASNTNFIDPEALFAMRQVTTKGTWQAYRNEDLGHPEVGHLKFLVCGPGHTFERPPVRLPDTATEINWCYQHVGSVDLDTGTIVEL